MFYFCTSVKIMKKPVTILTGFLGSGKTTFLNAILAEKKETKFAIIENEFGKEGIDGELVLKAEDDIVELNNGCLCCTLNDNLYDILNQLVDRKEKFDELIIETTGIADPAGVALPFISDSNKVFQLKRVVCLVDAELIEEQLKETEEAIRQISFSDIIILNKTSSISPAYLQELTDLMLKLNPFAEIVTEKDKSFPIEAIFSMDRNSKALEKNKETHGKCSGNHAVEDTSVIHSEKHDHHHHFAHGDITSLSFRFEKPFDFQIIHHKLMAFLLFQSNGVYRFKGVFYIADHPNKVILQSVGKSLSISGGKEWGENEEKVSRIVFIGRNLKPQGFEKLLNGCFAKTDNPVI
jgi:G3E family GTPase